MGGPVLVQDDEVRNYRDRQHSLQVHVQYVWEYVSVCLCAYVCVWAGGAEKIFPFTYSTVPCRNLSGLADECSGPMPS